MTKELTFDECYKAAKLVANCPKERVSAVLLILARSGFDGDCIEQVLAEAQNEKNMNHAYRRRRNNNMRENWLETTDETALMLRKAYDCNVSFSTISNLSGINRTQLYQYMRGTKNASYFTAKSIKETLTKIFEDIGV